MRLPLTCALAAIVGLAGIHPLTAGEATTPTPTPVPTPATQPAATAPVTKAGVEATITKAQTWLLAQQQPDGSFMPGGKFSLGATAMVLDALGTGPQALPASDPRITKALDLLLKNQQPDGGIYRPDEGLGNYVTSLSLMALSSFKLLDDPAYKSVVIKAQGFLFGIQNAKDGSIAEGGIGYGSAGEGHEDLSNTAMAVEALRRSGVPASDPHLQKALEFVQRCQNLSSHNKLPWAGNDGSAVYSPEESKAGGSQPTAAEAAGEAPKMIGYGGMTYQLISSYVALELKADDPRVAAALNWVKSNYRFDANPGMQPGKERQGLFYYYMAMAKTFDLLDATTLTLKDGTAVDWRSDLYRAIVANAVPSKDGTGLMWINSSDRWAEGSPHINAGYLLKALKRIQQSL